MEASKLIMNERLSFQEAKKPNVFVDIAIAVGLFALVGAGIEHFSS